MTIKIKDSGLGFKKGDVVLHNNVPGYVVGVVKDNQMESEHPILVAFHKDVKDKGYWRYTTTDTDYFPTLKELFPYEDPTCLCGWWCRVEDLKFLIGGLPTQPEETRELPELSRTLNESLNTEIESSTPIDWFGDCNHIEAMFEMIIEYGKRGYKIEYSPDTKRLTVIHGYKEYRNTLGGK